MLWLGLHFPRLPAEALGLRDPLDVVTDSRGPQRWLITPGPGDRLPAGMALGTALSIRAELRPHTRKPSAERAMLKSLAHTLYRYGSPVAAEIQDPGEAGRVPRALIWLEIGSSLRLFGGFDALIALLQADLDELQQCMQWAVAPTRRGAALLAVADPRRRVDDVPELERRLARFPTTTLAWPGSVLEAMSGMGLRRIGDLWRLPRAGFARRFGAERMLELDRLRGAAADPVVPIVPPPHFRRRFDFPAEVEGVEGLLFPLRRLAFDLQGWLRARELGVLSLTLEFEHAQKRRHAIHIRLLSPHRNGARLFETLRERLNREELPGAVRSLTLKAKDVARTAAGQVSLFASDEDAQLQWTETVERLMARLGEAALWTPAVHEDHRPECAIQRLTPGCSSAARAPQRRPTWLLPTPEALPSPPVAPGEAERIEGGWWSGDDVRRDYHRARLSQMDAWVFRNRDDGRWYLHGWWG
jgi:protein ImuB